MWHMPVNLLDNTMYEGLSYALVCLSMVISFRLLRFPDLTMEGSFILGPAIAAVLMVRLHVAGVWAIPLGVLAGAVAGSFTMFLHVVLRIDRLLAGALSAFCCYSLSIMIMGGFVAFGDVQTFWTPLERLDRQINQALPINYNLHILRITVLLAMTIFIKLLLDGGLRTEKGLVLRAVGENERAVTQCGISPAPYKIFGLAIANALVAFSGIIISIKEGNANATRGIGLIIVALTAYMIGEQLLCDWGRSGSERKSILSALTRIRTRVLGRFNQIELTTAAIVGCLLYFLIVQLGYMLGIRPELPRLLMGIYIILTIGDSSWLRRLFPKSTRDGS